MVAAGAEGENVVGVTAVGGAKSAVSAGVCTSTEFGLVAQRPHTLATGTAGRVIGTTPRAPIEEPPPPELVNGVNNVPSLPVYGLTFPRVLQLLLKFPSGAERWCGAT